MTGDAFTWAAAGITAGYPVDTTPRVGDVAVWAPNTAGMGPAGHVAFVEAVNGDGTITISQDQWGGGLNNSEDLPSFNWARVSASSASSYVHVGATVLAPKRRRDMGTLYYDGNDASPTYGYQDGKSWVTFTDRTLASALLTAIGQPGTVNLQNATAFATWGTKVTS